VAVPAWQVLSENRTLGQFEALRSGATPLVGRDEEMELLLRRWAHAKSGSGRVVLISAEPGVGKSRLAEALALRIADEPHVRLRYFCSSHHQDSALYPVIAQMERAAGFAHMDEPVAKLAKLQPLLAATVPPIEDVALIADLHALPSGNLVPPLNLTPQRKKEKTFEALLRQIEGLSRQQPVLMIFDDLHWIDPSSRELLDRVTERVADWPVLLLAMFRPEFQPPWTGLPHVTLLTLARLDRRDTAAMVANVAGNATLPPEIVAEIAERTDGVPLFIEELTKAVLESGPQGAAALSAVPHPSVPVTLHASLMARLDRLGPAAKEVAQTGAAIGREFGFGLLAPISDLPDPQLREALDRLTNAGLLFARGTPPDANYIFKHALVQDAAYGTLRAAGVSFCTAASPRLWKTAFRRSCWRNLHCWPTIMPKRVWPNRRSSTRTGPPSRPLHARQWRRRLRSCTKGWRC
jgi:predicted ATPase